MFIWCLCVSQVQKLQGILKPMMLRRLKEDVEKNLAPKEETIIEVRLNLIIDGSETFSFQTENIHWTQLTQTSTCQRPLKSGPFIVKWLKFFEKGKIDRINFVFRWNWPTSRRNTIGPFWRRISPSCPKEVQEEEEGVEDLVSPTSSTLWWSWGNVATIPTSLTVNTHTLQN